MSDAHFAQETKTFQENECCNHGCDTVCIDADRIYDSCGAKDCLRDLTLLLSEKDQEIVENACSVRIIKASVITSTVDVEPVVFHRGFYSVDIVFYFAVTIEVYTNSDSHPCVMTGLATYAKRVVLYGSDASAKTFSSDGPVICECKDKKSDFPYSLPKARVQISNPMALSANLKKCSSMPTTVCTAIPECVKRYFKEPLCMHKKICVAVTIGIFTITQLIRTVQITIPAYNYCIPRKECTSKTDDPCEAFSKIEFTTDMFFPKASTDKNAEDVNFECDCQ